MAGLPEAKMFSRSDRNRNPQSGFTILELLIALTVVGAVTVIAMPKLRVAMEKEAVRSARRAVTAELARARGAAASRGCRSVIHFTTGTSARVWVTACEVNGTNVDTVGAVRYLSQQYKVSVSSTLDSLTFVPSGVAFAPRWNSLAFTRSEHADSLLVSPLGKAVW